MTMEDEMSKIGEKARERRPVPAEARTQAWPGIATAGKGAMTERRRRDLENFGEFRRNWSPEPLQRYKVLPANIGPAKRLEPGRDPQSLSRNRGRPMRCFRVNTCKPSPD
ncbi:hypothetical protein Q1695_015129 [Nippostrongylus brasiliensis]|nr:hypothetical protein Q1695_015129 [Nippostrongylus brasiliensis]